MDIAAALSVIVLWGAMVVMATSPLVFADDSVIIRNTLGSSVPGCEETDECFIPNTVTIDVGGEVTWINEDMAAHTVTSGTLTDGPDGVFDSGLFAPNATLVHKFEEAGEYPYYCMVHPWMRGLVIVQETDDIINGAAVAPAKHEGAPSPTPYKTIHTRDYSMDVPSSYVRQPHWNLDIFSSLILAIMIPNELNYLYDTLISGRTDSFADVSAITEPSPPPTISIAAGPSMQPTKVFASDYNELAAHMYRMNANTPYLVYMNQTQHAGVLSKWLIYETDEPGEYWRLASYIVVVNETAYVIQYSAGPDTHDDNYHHFERAVSSFAPHPTSGTVWDDRKSDSVPQLPSDGTNTQLPKDPRCRGTAECITGYVTRVIDGNTLRIDNTRVRLALVNIDEPDTAQGAVAETIVSAVCQTGLPATIDEDDGQAQGGFNRMLGVVWCGAVNINEFLVAIDFGHIDTRFCEASEFSKDSWAAACHQ